MPDREVALSSSEDGVGYIVSRLQESSKHSNKRRNQDELDPVLYLSIRYSHPLCGPFLSCTNPCLKTPRINGNRISRSPTLPNILSITVDAICQQRRRRSHHVPAIAIPLRCAAVDGAEVVGASTEYAGCGALGVDVCAAATCVGR